jgi:hypothetical protein
MQSSRPFESAPKMLQPTDVCGIGKFKNTPLRDVPLTFFEWMREVERLYPRVYRGDRWLAVIKYLNFNEILIAEKAK